MTSINKKHFAALSLLVFVAVASFYIGKAQVTRATPSASPAENNFPTLTLPAKYFLTKDMTNWEDDLKGSWTSASINNQDVYQSYPSTDISFTDYSNESKPLSSVDMSGYTTGIKKTFGVEGDGSTETIETLCPSDSMDGYCGEIQIVKGTTVIFHATSDHIDILPSPTGNGFYVKSENDTLQPSRCCALGYVKTRFVYENGTFKPVYEQNVYYLNVRNTSSTQR